MTVTVSRINITLPKDLIADIKKAIPPRGRSRMIAEALREKIAKAKREEGLKKLKGVWIKAGGISFKSEADLRNWRKSLWATTEKRFAKDIRG